MNQSSLLFEIFLREGFEKCNFTSDLSDIIDKYAKVRKYKLNLPFYELLPEIRNGELPFIIFTDESVKLSHSDLLAIAELIQSNKDILSLTFNSNALQTVYGFNCIKNKLKWFAKKQRSITTIPSWFCIINRELLRKSYISEYKYKTLEFFLYEISEYLAKMSKEILLLDPVNFIIDSRLWARDIILKNSSHLALDYEYFVGQPKKHIVDIPYQFKVEISGEYALLPSNVYDISKNNDSPNPFFSVICPAFKSSFFEEMVQSVVNQSWKNWELIILIDGPPKEERERLESILERYSSDNRIQFYFQENKGTGPTRRRLAQMAKGDYIVTIDDDDMFNTDTLEIFAIAINQYTDASVFRGGAQLFGLIDLYLRPRQRIVIDSISSDLFEATQPFAIKRNVLTDLGGFVGDKCFREAGEDSDIFIKIDKAKIKTYLIDKPMYFRRINTVNQTLSLRPDECMDHIKSLINRHCPTGWKFSDILLEKDGPFIKASTIYKHSRGGCEVVAATKFFDYQTLGESSHVLIDLEITSMCNAQCTFCPRETIKRSSKFISMDLINILAEQISQEKGTRQVILCGIGEPTLHPELEKIVKKLTEAGTKVCMTTNGSLMNVDKFKKLADLGIVEFNFSLNAATSITHEKMMKMQNFCSIKSNLTAILKYKNKIKSDIEVNVSFVLYNYNQHEVYDFVNEWRKSGASKIWIHPVNNRAGLLNENITKVDMLSLKKEFTKDEMVLVDVFQHVSEDGNVCKIVQSLDFISVDGNMQICALDYQGKTNFGNLKNSSLQQMHLTKFLKYKHEGINYICLSCDFYPTTNCLVKEK